MHAAGLHQVTDEQAHSCRLCRLPAICQCLGVTVAHSAQLSPLWRPWLPNLAFKGAQGQAGAKACESSAWRAAQKRAPGSAQLGKRVVEGQALGAPLVGVDEAQLGPTPLCRTPPLCGSQDRVLMELVTLSTQLSSSGTSSTCRGAASLRRLPLSCGCPLQPRAGHGSQQARSRHNRRRGGRTCKDFQYLWDVKVPGGCRRGVLCVLAGRTPRCTAGARCP